MPITTAGRRMPRACQRPRRPESGSFGRARGSFGHVPVRKHGLVAASSHVLGDSPGGLTPDPLVALEEGGAAQPHKPPQRRWSPDDLRASGRLSARERQNINQAVSPIALGQEGGSARSRPLLVLGRVAPRRQAERFPSPPWGRAELARRSPPGGREPTVSP